MMDSVGHYSRPELLSLLINDQAGEHKTSLNSEVDDSHCVETDDK